MINQDSLIVDDARQNCEVTLNSPHKTLKTDEYVLFAKAFGEKHIEVNGVDLDEIQDFINKLNEIIKQNKDKLV